MSQEETEAGPEEIKSKPVSQETIADFSKFILEKLCEKAAEKDEGLTALRQEIIEKHNEYWTRVYKALYPEGTDQKIPELAI